MARSAKYSIHLRWLNTLGGWEHWNFTAWKTYGWEISEVETIEKDIFQNWDTDFITGETEREHLSIKAGQTLRVRSQDLTRDQINAIARIKFSIRVQDETSDAVTVIVDKNSFQYRTDNDKRHTIEFNISYPSEQIQSQ